MENVETRPMKNHLVITGAYVRPNRRDTNEKTWRNFAGSPTRWNPRGGDRRFVIDLNRSDRLEYGNIRTGFRPITVEELIDIGWKIKIYDNRDKYPDSTPAANLSVVVSYHDDPEQKWRDPKVRQYTQMGSVDLTENTIGALDNAWIDKCKCDLSPSDSMTAYLQSMHVYLKETNYGFYDWDGTI